MSSDTGLVINATKSFMFNPIIIPYTYILAKLVPAFILARISSLALSVAAERS
jgi:hypothetical protein|nr:MAG TPA: hypothetical protein [Caudoviricetes sp.]